MTLTLYACSTAPTLVFTRARRWHTPLPTCFLPPQQVLGFFLLYVATFVDASYLPWRSEVRHVAVVNECAGWLGVMTACLQYNDTGRLTLAAGLMTAKPSSTFTFDLLRSTAAFYRATDRWALKLIKYRIGLRYIVLINIGSINITPYVI